MANSRCRLNPSNTGTGKLEKGHTPDIRTPGTRSSLLICSPKQGRLTNEDVRRAVELLPNPFSDAPSNVPKAKLAEVA